MPAGESANDVARRKREKAARLLESADRWERGAIGEVAVAAAMAQLEADGWTLLHDVSWPGRKFANVDHVAIGNGNVFVIDAKNWTGEVSTSGGVLRQNGRSRTKEVAAVSEAARAVGVEVPGIPADAVRPVLCLVRDDWLSARFGDVLVCSSHNLVAQLRGQPQSNQLSPQVVVQLVEALRNRSTPSRQRLAEKATKPAQKRGRSRSRIKAAKVAMVAVVLLVLLVQPAWFRAALDRASQEFVSLVSPSITEPQPAEPAPEKKDDHKKGKHKTPDR